MVEILFMRMFAFFQLHPVAEPIATSISEDGKKLLARAFVVVFFADSQVSLQKLIQPWPISRHTHAFMR